MKIFKHKEKKHLETSKKVLFSCLFLEIILLIIIMVGWYRNLDSSYQFFFGDVALIIATVVSYSIKATFENVQKGKCGFNILPDLLTMLGGMFNALNSGDIPSAISTIINAAQMIVQGHPELTQKDNPMFNNNFNVIQSNPTPRGEGDNPVVKQNDNNSQDDINIDKGDLSDKT